MLTRKHFPRGSGTQIHKYSSSKGQIQTKKKQILFYLLKAKRTANSVNKKALSVARGFKQTPTLISSQLVVISICSWSVKTKIKVGFQLNYVNLNMWRNSCGGDRETENRLDFWQKSYSCNLSDSADEILPNTNTNTNI